MSLTMKYNCGCVATRGDSTQSFVIQVLCMEHGIESAGGKRLPEVELPDIRGFTVPRAQVPQHPAPEMLPDIDGPDADVTHCVTKAARHFYPSYRDEPENVWAVCEYGVDNNLAHVFGHNGNTSKHNAKFVADALNAYVGGASIETSAKLAAAVREKNNREWATIIQLVVKEYGLEKTLVEVPQLPSMLAIRGVFAAIHAKAERSAEDAILDKVSKLIRGYGP